jgi:hypothetical protein
MNLNYRSWVYEPLPGGQARKPTRRRPLFLIIVVCVAIVLLLISLIRYFTVKQPYHPLDNYQKLQVQYTQYRDR